MHRGFTAYLKGAEEMFDSYVLSGQKIRNIADPKGNITGYEMKTRITYYRGIPLSMIHDVRVEADGVAVPREQIRFSCDGIDFFTLDEMETVTTYKWEYGTEATIIVEQGGGLAKGSHDITLSTAVRVEYVPVPFAGSRTVNINIA